PKRPRRSTSACSRVGNICAKRVSMTEVGGGGTSGAYARFWANATRSQSRYGAPMHTHRHLLVPTDFADAATRAFRVATALAREHRGRLTVLHVVTPYQPVTQLPEVTGWISDAGIHARTH